MKRILKIISPFLFILCIGYFSAIASADNLDESQLVIVDTDGTEYEYAHYTGEPYPYYEFFRRGNSGQPFVDTIYVKSEINGIPVRRIRICSGVRKLVLSDSITTIDDMAFAEGGIEEIVLSDSVTYIGPGAFWLSCLKKVTFGSGMKILKTKGFSDCRYLEDIVIKEGVTSIENGVFIGDSKIKTITLPASITNIEKHAFNLNLNNPTIYGYSGSYAERWAKSMGYTFKSIGTAPVITDFTPTLGITGIKGNTVEVYAYAANDEWEYYEYNISCTYKRYDEDYGITYTPEKLAFRYWGNQDESVKFSYIPAGKYYVSCRGIKDTEDGKEFSNWSIPCIITIRESNPAAPQYLKAQVTKNKNGMYDVTVTLKVKNTLKYDAVLANSYAKTELYDIREYNERNWRTIYDTVPYTYNRIVKKNQKAQTITFKNIRKGTYYFEAHCYTKNSDGKKVFSKWSRPGKIKVG